jgi:hypothetical protein
MNEVGTTLEITTTKADSISESTSMDFLNALVLRVIVPALDFEISTLN